MVLNCDVEKNKLRLAIELSSFLLKSKEKPIFLCVGTDKVVGDLVGVIVGELLSKKYHPNAYVYGNLDYAVTNKNIPIVVEYLKQNYPQNPVIVIDGICGETHELKHIKAYEHGCVPGGEFGFGVPVGDYSILGVVDVKGIDKLGFLKSVKLKTVVGIAEFIAESINMAYKFCGTLVWWLDSRNKNPKFQISTFLLFCVNFSIKIA